MKLLCCFVGHHMHYQGYGLFRCSRCNHQEVQK